MESKYECKVTPENMSLRIMEGEAAEFKCASFVITEDDFTVTEMAAGGDRMVLSAKEDGLDAYNFACLKVLEHTDPDQTDDLLEHLLMEVGCRINKIQLLLNDQRLAKEVI